MRQPFDQQLVSRLIAITIGSLALMVLISLWALPTNLLDSNILIMLLISIFLGAAVVCCGLYPIHIRHNIKIILTTVPLYAVAILLPPAIAALVAGMSILLIDLLTRSRTGNTVSDIVTASGRWVLIAYISATVGQSIYVQQMPLFVLLLGVAITMFGCELLTAVLEIGPISGEPPVYILLTLIREISLSEAILYLLGMLVVLAAQVQVWSLLLWVIPVVVVYQAFKHVKEMHDGTSQFLESLADAIDLRDSYTGGHSRRVTEYSVQIMHAMGMTGPEVELIRSAARVHDIGKIGVPDQILNKPGRLSDEEKSVMDSHPVLGAELLTRYKDFARGIDIVRYHHERWDGKGYPDGLAGLAIPLGARIVAVADSYDAMTSDRPYRVGMPISKAAKILYEGRGTQWDASIVDAFLQTLNVEIPETSPEPQHLMPQVA